MTKVILASGSPRRTELLNQIKIEHTVEISQVEEITDSSLPFDEQISILAMQKAVAVAEKHKGEDLIVIGADTVVIHNGAILGKPKDSADAYRILEELQGSAHEVLTAIALIRPGDGKIASDCVRTEVQFRSMSHEEIQDYIATNEPMDKAGAYGIQGVGAKYISGIKGDYFNVMGLPLCRLVQILKQKYDMEL